jgi:hypothetical protein
LAATRVEFANWRASQCYQELVGQIQEQAEVAATEILNRSEPNVARDQFLKGFVNAMSEVVAWSPEFIEEGFDEEA